MNSNRPQETSYDMQGGLWAPHELGLELGQEVEPSSSNGTFMNQIPVTWLTLLEMKGDIWMDLRVQIESKTFAPVIPNLSSIFQESKSKTLWKEGWGLEEVVI